MALYTCEFSGGDLNGGAVHLRAGCLLELPDELLSCPLRRPLSVILFPGG